MAKLEVSREWRVSAVLLWYTMAVGRHVHGLSATSDESPTAHARLTAAALSVYVDKTFGFEQRCLRVLVDDTDPTAVATSAALYQSIANDPVSRTVELNVDDVYNLNDRFADWKSCPASVAIVGRWAAAGKALEEFRENGVERMLLIVVTPNKTNIPYNKVTVERLFSGVKFILNDQRTRMTPELLENIMVYTAKYFNYKDIILLNINSEKETIYRMDMYYQKFVPISKQDKWFRHDVDGKWKVKNFYGTRIKLMTFNNSLYGNVIENKTTGEIELGDGVECRIFLEISKKLNLTVKLVSTDEKDKWGTVWPNGSLTGGATKFLYYKKVDVAFCSMWIEYYRRGYVEMSDYWSYMCIKFLVIKPKPLRDKWNLLFKPFSLGLWVLLFASATLNTITLWMIAIVQKKIGLKHINIFTSLSSSVSCIFGIMLMTNNPIRSHRLGPIRHLISWWCLFVFVMSTAFSSVLYSYITSPEYSEPITSIEQMVKEGYSWGLPYPPPMPFLLKMEDPWHVKFSQKFIPERDTTDRINRVINGKYAVMTKCVKDKHFMETHDLPPSLLNDLRTTRSCLNHFYIGFGFSKQSPYLKSANLVIKQLVESGIIGYWLNRVFEARIPPATFERVYEQKPLADRNGDPSPLTVHQFRAVLVGWLIGCFLSAIVFVVECKYAEKRQIMIPRRLRVTFKK